jgi:hypothetical protein
MEEGSTCLVKQLTIDEPEASEEMNRVDSIPQRLLRSATVMSGQKSAEKILSNFEIAALMICHFKNVTYLMTLTCHG